MNSEDYKDQDWSNWTTLISKYAQPSRAKSWWQIINTFVPYFLLWVAMIYSLSISYWLTLGLSLLAAGFLVRIFIIFHDCGHGSFFRSPKANLITGIISGLLVFTPYHRWHYEHQKHHQTVGNLDKRGVGDVMTLTVEEYKNTSKRQKFWYKIYRNPIILLILVPFLLFTIKFRFQGSNQTRKMHLQTHLTTLALIIGIFLISWLIGFKTFLLIQVPTLLFASTAGVWLFYLQHQYKDVLWVRNDRWDYRKVAMEGSSYLKLPAILQWFSGNIGFHHIHHLSPKIPNYNLEKCYRENIIFRKDPLTFREIIQSVRYRLWDEKKHRLVAFSEI